MTPRHERLLAMIDDRPKGEKVNIPALIRAFTPTQAETVQAIEYFIEHGKLDALTLRRPLETPAEVKPPAAEPPGPGAAEGGGGAARDAVAPPSFDLDRLLQSFGDEFETLRIVAARFGAPSFRNIVRHTRTLHERGLVEQSPPVSGQPFLLWRRANSVAGIIPRNIPAAPLQLPDAELAELPAKLVEQLSTPAKEQIGRAREKVDAGPSPRELLAEIEAFCEHKHLSPTRFGKLAVNDFGLIGRLKAAKSVTPKTAARIRAFIAHEHKYPGASGTAREAPSAEESTSAKRTEGRAPIEEPASAVAPSARARPVDIKVNARRDPTQPPEMPLTELRDRQVLSGHRHAASIRRSREAAATAKLDAGEQPANSFERGLMNSIELRREEERRLADPVEQAKAVLRRRFTPVVAAEFADPAGPRGSYLVGRKIVTEQELLAMAADLAA